MLQIDQNYDSNRYIIDMSNAKTQISNDIAKKCIIVLGNMGDGKTSKISNYIDDQGLLVDSTGDQSVTKQVSLYRVDRFGKGAQFIQKLQANQDIYFIDTPGLNSKKKKPIQIANQIQKLNIIDNTEIFAILYVVNINQGRQKFEEFKEIYQLLIIKNSIKKKILILILTYYDKNHKEQKFIKRQKQWGQKMREMGLQEVWERRINWINRPNPYQQSFDQKFNDVQHQLYQYFHFQQKNKFFQILKNILTSKFYISLQTQNNYINQFYNVIQKKLINFTLKSKSLTKQKLQIKYRIQKKTPQNLQKFINYSVVFSTLFGGHAALFQKTIFKLIINQIYKSHYQKMLVDNGDNQENIKAKNKIISLITKMIVENTIFENNKIFIPKQLLKKLYLGLKNPIILQIKQYQRQLNLLSFIQIQAGFKQNHTSNFKKIKPKSNQNGCYFQIDQSSLLLDMELNLKIQIMIPDPNSLVQWLKEELIKYNSI